MESILLARVSDRVLYALCFPASHRLVLSPTLSTKTAILFLWQVVRPQVYQPKLFRFRAHGKDRVLYNSL